MRCFAKINLKNLEHNILEIEKKVDRKKILAIVKANAYGHGSVRLYKEMIKLGIEWFGVAGLDEALELRKEDKNSNIIILGPISKEDMETASSNDIRFIISNMSDLKYLISKKINATIHLKVDTGMRRVGFNSKEIYDALKIIKDSKQDILEGIFTHLSMADEDDEYSLKQLEEFDEIVKKFPEIKIKHALNSYGAMKFSEKYTYDLIRPGILLYGGADNKDFPNFNFKPVMSLYAKVTNIKEINEDSYIGYGKTCIVKKGDVIATLSIGYADGVRRALGNKGYVYFNGKRRKIVGNVCMDQLMIILNKEDLENKEELRKEDVEIFGDKISVLETSDLCDTISYEILCGISKRVTRIYE